MKKFRRKEQQAEKDKIERVTGLGRRTREEIAKWNQMTALRFQTGGRQTSPASLQIMAAPAFNFNQYKHFKQQPVKHNAGQKCEPRAMIKSGIPFEYSIKRL